MHSCFRACKYGRIERLDEHRRHKGPANSTGFVVGGPKLAGLALLLCLAAGCDRTSNEDRTPAATLGFKAMVPVDLPIPHVRQQTPVWCWAAVAQQIILASNGPDKTPAQCALVAAANGASAPVCCGGYNSACVSTGSLEQIEGLIYQFTARSSSTAAPADPAKLYAALGSGHAVIVGVTMGGNARHVVVVRGMSFAQSPSGPEPMVHVNDPMQPAPQFVPFDRIAPYWQSAIVVN